MSLSERIRPNIEAAPWVCDEVAKIESALATSYERERHWQTLYERERGLYDKHDAALATANERIREMEAAERDWKQVYERFKATHHKLMDEYAAEREVSDKLVAELQSAIQTLEDINDLPSMRACMEQTLSEVAAIRKQGGEG